MEVLFIPSTVPRMWSRSWKWRWVESKLLQLCIIFKMWWIHKIWRLSGTFICNPHFSWNACLQNIQISTNSSVSKILQTGFLWCGLMLDFQIDTTCSIALYFITSFVQYNRPCLLVLFWRVVFRNRTGIIHFRLMKMISFQCKTAKNQFYLLMILLVLFWDLRLSRVLFTINIMSR